jgi:hypothetical protein
VAEKARLGDLFGTKVELRNLKRRTRMSSFRRPRVSAGLVISIVALVVALGGTSYAAFSLPKNSVGTKQLKKNAVTSNKVKNGSLLAVDFKAGQLHRGPKGDPGQNGAPGTARAFGTVAQNGTLAPGSKNLTSKRVSVGRYCVTPAPSLGVNLTTSAPMATGYEFEPVVPAIVHGSAFCPDGWLISTLHLQGVSTATLVLDDASFEVAVP